MCKANWIVDVCPRLCTPCALGLKTCPGRFTSRERSGRRCQPGEVVSPSALETIVRHDGRLDILCCILDGGPLAVPQLSARTGSPARLVGHWVRLLDAFGLVEKLGDLGGEEPLYAATLDEHPDWVREAVEEHRRR